MLAMLRALRFALATAPELWQYELLSARQMGVFASKLGVEVSDQETILGLWRVGLLRADLVVSDVQIAVPGLTTTKRLRRLNTYLDHRCIHHRPSGFGGILAEAPEIAGNSEPWFHPFRLYILYHIERIFKTSATCTQYLNWPDGITALAKRQIAHFDEWTAKREASERFDYWNMISELAIALEPLAYPKIHHRTRIKFPMTEKSQSLRLTSLRAKAAPLVRQITVAGLQQVREELGQAAQNLDSNQNLHVLLRLMSSHERGKLRGRLGACMLFLEMAEVIRRPVESETGRCLPEEDQIGYGRWIDGARTAVYGTERVFDATPTVLRDYLTSVGLDYGIKIRCYVEGDSEYGALSSAVGDLAGIEIINLRGQVVERRGKGLAIWDALLRNSASNIFSVVMVDADRLDYVRAVRQAASSRGVFCPFFLSDPDFEFGNFTAQELLSVAIKLGRITCEAMAKSSDLEERISKSTSNKEFFDAIASAETTKPPKDDLWGAELMSLAMDRPEFPPEHALAGQTRPIVEAARLLNRARTSGYLRSLAAASVDPDTGKILRRSSAA